MFLFFFSCFVYFGIISLLDKLHNFDLTFLQCRNLRLCDQKIPGFVLAFYFIHRLKNLKVVLPKQHQHWSKIG